MEIKNLTPEQVKTLEGTLCEMQQYNPHLDWRNFPMGDPTGPAVDPTSPHYVPAPSLKDSISQSEVRLFLGDNWRSDLQMLSDQVAALNRKIDLIFGHFVIVDGRFVDLNPDRG